MAENIRKLDIPYFEGANALMSESLSKKTELFHCENCRSVIIGTIEKRGGTRRLGDVITSTINYGIVFFANDGHKGFFRVAKVSSVTSIYYLNNSANWTTLSGAGTSLTTTNNYRFNFTIAENTLFAVNGDNNNLEISGSDGITVTASTGSSGNLYGSPKARKINYYKDRLYLGDYIIGSTRYKNGIFMSSVPLGIVALVDGDHDQPVTSLKVTDLKYIRSSDSLDVYRGGTKIGTITVSAKNATTNTLTISSFGTNIKSSDELWVADTYSGTRKFRWADNAESGIDVKRYDTFKLAGSQNDRITMMTNIGDVMMLATNHSLAVWNDNSLANYEMEIGCVSDEAYVNAYGTLYFLGYEGIFATNGGQPKLISAKIDPYITGATKAGLESACMGKKGFSIFCVIGAVTLYNADGSIRQSLSDVCLEYNTKTLNWYIHIGIKATQFATYRETSGFNRLIYESTESGLPCFEFLTGELDDKVTSDKEITFRADLPNFTLSEEFENIVYPLEIIVEAERGSGIQCFISLDDEDWYEIQGEIRKGVNVLKVTSKDSSRSEPPSCRRIRISFRDSSVQLCKISKVKIKYKDTNEVVIPFHE